MNLPIPTLRPSALPKLAECPKFQGQESAGDAAARGTLMDTAYRALLAGEEYPPMPDEDRRAVEWAVTATRIWCGPDVLIHSDEIDLKSKCSEYPIAEGTADAMCQSKMVSFDLKSGQMRDYEAQMAAYASGFMDRLFCTQWTTVLLFCDERLVVEREWTPESVDAVLRPITAQVLDEYATPRINDYCGWCAHKWHCPAWTDLMKCSMHDPDWDFDAIKAVPWRLAQFLRHEKAHADFQKQAKDHAKSLTEPIPGWKKQQSSGRRTVAGEWLADHLPTKEAACDALREASAFPLSKAEAVWHRHNQSDIPFAAIQTAPNVISLVEDKPKTK